MSNWCFNLVTFNGDKENLDKLASALDKAKKSEQKEKDAQKIHSLESAIDGLFFEIYSDYNSDNSDITIQYDTQWTPNLKDVSQLCKEYKVSAEHEYKEPGMQVYGTAVYKESGDYTDNPIEQEFLELIAFDDESGMYVYESEYWDSEAELIASEYSIWKEKNL